MARSATPSAQYVLNSCTHQLIRSSSVFILLLIWFIISLTLALLVAPAAFSQLPSAVAGEFVGLLLDWRAKLGLLLGIASLLLWFKRDLNMSLLLLALLVLTLTHWGLAETINAAKQALHTGAANATANFARVHRYAVIGFGVEMLVLLLLVCRLGKHLIIRSSSTTDSNCHSA